MHARNLIHINLSPIDPRSRGDIGCDDCPIRSRAVCAYCETDELVELDEIKFYRTYEAGQTIAWEGDEMEFVGSVVSGVASLTQTLEDGRTQMVGLLLPSDFLGRPGRDKAAYNATAITDIVLCCFRRRPFDKMMAATPHIAQRLLQMTLDELDAAREWMLLLGRKTAREKIASFITILARREAALHKVSPGDRMAIELPLTREAMADYLGLTLETVSRQINALKREGVIELSGKRGVILPDFARLVTESGDDSDGGCLS
jgi:CRP/FNR family transcriptional regulator